MTSPDLAGDSGASWLRVVGIEDLSATRVEDVIALGDKHRNILGHATHTSRPVSWSTTTVRCLRPWTTRADADQLRTDRAEVEASLRRR